MGHAVDYTVFDEFATKEEMYAASEEFAYYSVDRGENPSGSYSNSWCMYRQIFDCYDDAVDFFENKGAYEDGCVRFKEESENITKKAESIKERICKQQNILTEYNNSHNIKVNKSGLVTCSHCGSKITASFIHGHNCPVCNHDLRSETVKEKINTYETKIVELKRQYRDEVRKASRGKASIKWLVKTEVHC